MIASDAVESIAFSGGLAAIVATLELVLSATILGLGAGGFIDVLLLVGWVVMTDVLCASYTGRRNRWTSRRLQMTGDLIEAMAGHGTRQVQSSPDAWHREEDECLDDYLAASRELDSVDTRLMPLAADGWLVVGFAGLAPTLLSAVPSDLFALALPFEACCSQNRR